MEQKRHTTIQLGLYYNSIPNRKWNIFVKDPSPNQLNYEMSS